MRALYTLGIHMYTGLIKLARPFNDKARLWVAGRKHLTKQVKSRPKEQKCIWVHAASLGEFEQGRPLIEAIKKQSPDVFIHLTFFSPSGYEIRKNYEHADSVSYLPQDTPAHAKAFVEALRPDLAIFIKYEYWYNIMRVLENAQIPLLMASAIFRKKQIFFKPWGSWFAAQLKSISHFYVQNQDSLDLLKQLGYTNVTLSGDTRFDRVREVAQTPLDFPEIETFKTDKQLLIAGSTWPKDEEILAETFEEQQGRYKLLIAPHEIHEAHLQQIEKRFQFTSTKRLSEYEGEDVHVLIIDSIGKLMHMYQYGTWAYIGGGFNSGIHNILEAATFGLPVVFGPKHENFNEAVELLEKGGAQSVNDSKELQQTLNLLTDNKEVTRKKSQTCKDYTIERSGASKTILSSKFVKKLTS